MTYIAILPFRNVLKLYNTPCSSHCHPWLSTTKNHTHLIINSYVDLCNQLLHCHKLFDIFCRSFIIRGLYDIVICTSRCERLKSFFICVAHAKRASQTCSLSMYVGILIEPVAIHKQECLFVTFENGHVKFIYSQIACKSNKIEGNKSTQLCKKLQIVKLS